MQATLLSASLALFALTGCDTLHGVRRSAAVHAVPDLTRVKERIESYPERIEVALSESVGGRTLTFTGIHEDDQVFYVSYSDDKNIQGTLMFERDYRGRVIYSQYQLGLSPLPQAWIDATWPVMKRIELDLAMEFGLPELCDGVKVRICGVKHPERNEPRRTTERGP